MEIYSVNVGTTHKTSYAKGRLNWLEVYKIKGLDNKMILKNNTLEV